MPRPPRPGAPADADEPVAKQIRSDPTGTTADLLRDAQRVAVDLFVFAPIGFAKRARTLLPDLIRDGRASATSAKTIGKFVTPIARRQGAKLVKSKVEALSRPKPRSLGPVESARRPTAAAQPSPSSGLRVEDFGSGEPFDGYDHLGSAAVVARLGELSASQRADVLRYERGHRNRQTILGRLDQLDSAT